MKKLTLVAALLLAGCGSGGDNGPTSEPPAPPPTPGADAFFVAVSEVVATAPEQSEPANVDALAATAPENNDPSPL